MSTIVLTGGGTAGHVTPHIALKPYLDKHFGKVVYIGSKNGVEKDILQKHGGFEFYAIDPVKLDRSKFWKNFLIPFKFIKSKNQAKKILKQVRPSIIFSKGGYVALPVVFAGKSLKIPIVAHESDLSLGLANKLSKHKCNCICTTFEKTAQTIGKKGIYTGTPTVVCANKTPRPKTDKPILLVTGGSLGCKAINQAVFENLDKLCTKFFVIHQVGKGNINKTSKNSNYMQFEFSLSMQNYMHMADVVVTRAGSNTIFELAKLHKPMLLIPLPKAASRGDQIDNANYFESLGYAKILFQENLSGDTLLKNINDLYSQRNKYKQALSSAKFPNGTQKIMDILLTYKKPY